jgi:hypothetical protein
MDANYLAMQVGWAVLLLLGMLSSRRFGILEALGVVAPLTMGWGGTVGTVSALMPLLLSLPQLTGAFWPGEDTIQNHTPLAGGNQPSYMHNMNSVNAANSAYIPPTSPWIGAARVPPSWVHPALPPGAHEHTREWMSDGWSEAPGFCPPEGCSAPVVDLTGLGLGWPRPEAAPEMLFGGLLV